MTDPFALFDKLNAAKVTREAEEVEQIEFGTDRARIERDAKRRKKSKDGTLRARAHPNKRPKEVRGRVIRGYMEMGFSPDE